MRKFFEVSNIRCSGCSNTISNSLSDAFRGVEVDIQNGIVSAEIDDEKQEELFIETLRSLGYPLKSENLSGVQVVGLKARSFASCAIGKFIKKKGD